MYKLPIHILLFLCLSSLSITAYSGNSAEFDQWMKQQKSSFQEYRDKRDKEFTGFLQKQWKEMQTFQGLVRDDTPKPIRLPKAPKKSPKAIKPVQPNAIPIAKIPQIKPLIVKIPVIKSIPKPIKVAAAPTIRIPHGTKISLNFYGQNLDFYLDPKLKSRLQQPINEANMSKIWSDLSKADFEGLLKQINAQRNPLLLNDWSYALLTHAIAAKIQPGRKNDQAIFTWFMLTKAGYKSRIAYDSRTVYLLMPSQQKLFAAPYFTFDNTRYYALSFDGSKQKPGRIFTYNGHYPGATKALDMSLSRSINTGRQTQARDLKFTFKGKTHVINIGYDTQTVNFLKTYPQMDIALYFNSNVNQATGNPILKQLKPLLQGKSEEDAVNLLLRFVQTAFKYKTDEQQFGIENYLFPEETLFYPYSDCEDRSIFFAWLVDSLLGLKVVGLDFPGHIATAVHFNEEIPGDAFQYNGMKYVITDPTYINANAGMTMPNFKNLKPSIIRVYN